MHVGLTLTSDDDDAAMRRWALCRPLDNIANSNGTLPLEGGSGGVICPRPRVELESQGL
jgi:hypothetical protein